MITMGITFDGICYPAAARLCDLRSFVSETRCTLTGARDEVTSTLPELDFQTDLIMT